MPGQPSGRRHSNGCGGSPALDFTNTVSWSAPERTNERLRSYADLVRWTRSRGLAEPERGPVAEPRGPRPGPGREAESVPARSSFAMRCTTSSAPWPAGSEPDGPTIRAAQPIPRAGHSGGSGSAAADRADGRGDGASGRSSSARSGGSPGPPPSSSTSDELPLLKRCADDQCGWVFLDRSRNHARRWCDMQVCGNNQKARRFYRRKTVAGALD